MGLARFDRVAPGGEPADDAKRTFAGVAREPRNLGLPIRIELAIQVLDGRLRSEKISTLRAATSRRSKKRRSDRSLSSSSGPMPAMRAWTVLRSSKSASRSSIQSSTSKSAVEWTSLDRSPPRSLRRVSSCWRMSSSSSASKVWPVNRRVAVLPIGTKPASSDTRKLRLLLTSVSSVARKASMLDSSRLKSRARINRGMRSPARKRSRYSSLSLASGFRYSVARYLAARCALSHA